MSAGNCCLSEGRKGVDLRPPPEFREAHQLRPRRRCEGTLAASRPTLGTPGSPHCRSAVLPSLPAARPAGATASAPGLGERTAPDAGAGAGKVSCAPSSGGGGAALPLVPLRPCRAWGNNQWRQATVTPKALGLDNRPQQREAPRGLRPWLATAAHRPAVGAASRGLSHGWQCPAAAGRAGDFSAWNLSARTGG